MELSGIEIHSVIDNIISLENISLQYIKAQIL